MRRCRPAALLLGLATAAALPGTAAQELVTNGGFEAGNLKNWVESCVSLNDLDLAAHSHLGLAYAAAGNALTILPTTRFESLI